MADFSLEVDLTELLGAVESAADDIAYGAKRGMHDALDAWVREAVDLAPISKSGGTLRKSITKGDVEGSGLNLVAEVTANAVEVSKKGSRFNYAYYLHEVYPEKFGRRYFKHPTAPGTIPEFIATPAVWNGEKWMRDIEDEIKDELKRKGW